MSNVGIRGSPDARSAESEEHRAKFREGAATNVDDKYMMEQARKLHKIEKENNMLRKQINENKADLRRQMIETPSSQRPSFPSSHPPGFPKPEREKSGARRSSSLKCALVPPDNNRIPAPTTSSYRRILQEEQRFQQQQQQPLQQPRKKKKFKTTSPLVKSLLGASNQFRFNDLQFDVDTEEEAAKDEQADAEKQAQDEDEDEEAEYEFSLSTSARTIPTGDPND